MFYLRFFLHNKAKTLSTKIFEKIG